jgi:integrase
MKQQQAKFWSDTLTNLRGGRGRESVRQRRFQEMRVLRYLKRTHPKIFSGIPDASFTLSDSNKLFKQLKRSANTLEYITSLRFLIRGLEAGKLALGWPDVIVPVMPFLAPREPSRFTPLTFRSLNEVQSIQSSFARHLESPPDKDPTRHLGTILLSAVLYGGLLSANWLTPLLRGLPDRVVMSGSLMWLELRRPYVYPKLADQQAKRKHVNRRWVPDPLTQALILRLHLHYQHHLTACSRLDALTCLKSALHHISDNHATPSIRNLYKGASCYLALRVPGFLVSYASGKTHSASLPAHVWARFISGKGNKLSDDGTEDTSPEMPEQLEVIRSNTTYDIRLQEKHRKQLIKILGDSRRNRMTCLPTRIRIETFLETTVHSMVPVVQMLYHWAIEMLTRLPAAVPGRNLKVAFQPSSVATYLEAIDRELIACAGTDDISKYAPEELRDLYFDTLKALPNESQIPTTSFRLTQFHHFLVRNFSAPNIDHDGFIQKRGPPELGVDANLISPAMFRMALYSLGWDLPFRSRNQTIRCLIAILGYRCGLRHSEALCLRIGDLMGEQHSEILVRTSYLNRTKTPDSTRRIPASLLLEPKELEELRYWQRLRIAEEGIGDCLNSPLFGAPGYDCPPSDNEVFVPILRVLRHITGDSTVVYHHLRHSFANRLLLVMLSARLSDALLNESIRDFCSFHLSPQKLIAGLFGNMDQGRQFLYGVSTLMGHAGLYTTLLSYLHLCDWLLGQMVRDSTVQPDLSLAAIMQITGLKRAMVFRIKNDSKQSDWRMVGFLEGLARQGKNLFPDALADTTTDVTPIPPQTEEKVKSVPNWRILEHALKLHQVQSMSYDEIGNRLKVSSASIKMWCLTAEQIHGLTTSDGTPRHLTAWQRKRIRDQDHSKTVFPTPSDYSMDQDIVNKILKKVGTLSDNELEEIRTGCRLFVERYSTNQGFVRFTDTAGAAGFRKFLRLVGVPESMVYVTMFTKSSLPTPEELSEQLQLIDIIGVKPDHMISKGKRHIRYRRTHECSVGFIVARNDRTIKRKDKEVQIETLHGFRYAMYLLAIGLGYFSVGK